MDGYSYQSISNSAVNLGYTDCIHKVRCTCGRMVPVFEPEEFLLNRTVFSRNRMIEDGKKVIAELNEYAEGLLSDNRKLREEIKELRNQLHKKKGRDNEEYTKKQANYNRG